MPLSLDIQQSWHSALVELFVLSEYDPDNPSAEVLFTNEQTAVVWQSRTYNPLPVDASGFKYTAKGKLPRPRLRIGNVGGIAGGLIRNYNELIGAKLTRKRTLAKYLDGQPEANPSAFFPDDVWYVERKVKENRFEIEFELSSILDQEGTQIPNRVVVQSPCTWLWIGGYRGPYCGYTGPAVATENDTPTTDPQLDRCGGRLASCKLRQWPDGVLNYGSFPGARRYE